MEDIFANPNQFGLKVKGDSMQGAGILEGDVVIVNSDAEWINGDIIVAIIDEMATVKRVKQDKYGNWWLEPDNPKYEPLPLNEEVQIVGKVVAVIRKYS